MNALSWITSVYSGLVTPQRLFQAAAGYSVETIPLKDSKIEPQISSLSLS